jgi:hypothetical protein
VIPLDCPPQFRRICEIKTGNLNNNKNKGKKKMSIRIQTLPYSERKITMSKREYQNTMTGLLLVFGIASLFSIMAFFMAIIALCK